MNPYSLAKYEQERKAEEDTIFSEEDASAHGHVLKHVPVLARIAQLADIINMEFKSDPHSVACFDLRIVKELDEKLTELEAI